MLRHFPGGPGLASTRMSALCILLELRMMDVMVTTGAIRHAKLQSSRHLQQTNTQYLYRPDALPVAQPTVSEHWRKNLCAAIKAYKLCRSHQLPTTVRDCPCWRTAMSTTPRPTPSGRLVLLSSRWVCVVHPKLLQPVLIQDNTVYKVHWMQLTFS